MGYVSKRVIKAWLNRKLRDSRKAKRFSERALDRKLAQLSPRPVFKTKPYKHQKVCFLLGIKRKGYLFFLDMGLGKTKLALDLYAWLHNAKEVQGRMLVLVPNSVNVSGWIEEAEVHQPLFTCMGFEGDTSKDDREALAEDETVKILVMTYHGLMHMVCDNKGGKLKPNDTKCKHFFRRFGMMVMDESSVLSNNQSLPFRVCRKAMKYIPRRYALTGTPIGRNPQHFWAQFFLVDKGETLGATLGFFRNVFFDEKQGYFGGFEYTFRSSMQKALNRMLRHNSIRYRDSECLDLPPLIRKQYTVTFSEEVWDYYDRLVQELKAVKGNFQLVDNVYHRSRQLASGYLSYTDPEGERHDITFKTNPKLDMLMDVFSEVPVGKKVLIFVQYTRSGDMICERLKKAKVGHGRIKGGMTKHAKVIGKFRNDPKCRVLVVQNDAGSMGLNLQAANYVWFYESPDDPRKRRQAEKRAHRGGQKHTVFIGDFAVKNSVDEKILGFIEEGKSFHDALVEGKANL